MKQKEQKEKEEKIKNKKISGIESNNNKIITNAIKDKDKNKKLQINEVNSKEEDVLKDNSSINNIKETHEPDDEVKSKDKLDKDKEE